MTLSFLKIFISLLLLSNALSFGMLVPVDPRFAKMAAAHYYKILKPNKVEQPKKPMLLVEAAPLDAIGNTYLPKDILLEVGESCNIKNELKNTCRFLHKQFSKTKHNMYRLALLNKTCFSKQDNSFIILNAAWDKRTDVMISILNNTKERQFYYDVFVQHNYNKDSGARYVIFDLHDICEINKMGSSDDIIAFPLNIKDVKGNMFQYDLQKAKRRTSLKIVPLMVAVAYGVMKDIIDALDNVCKIDDVYGLIMVFAIAIEQNNLDYIKELLLKVKEMKQMDFVFSYFYYDILLRTAMIGNKKEAFELLVKEDPFDCLNFCASGRSTLNRLEKVNGCIDNQDEYITIYKKHGGKYYWEICESSLKEAEEEKKEKDKIREEAKTSTSSFWSWF